MFYFPLSTELGSQLNENSIDSGLVQKYLTSIGSDLACRVGEPIHLYKKLQLVCHLTDKKVDEKLSAVFAPRNVALLFFNRNPDIFFNGARSEIAIFTYDNDAKEEKKLTGPIDQQIKKCLSSILEIPKKEACHAIVAYPERALREAVVNAFHHRSYESCDPDPVKIHIKPNFIEIISYPGPDPCLKQEHFSESKEVPPVPSRNRRIADFLKSMKLAEGRYTGVGTIFRSMKENNNPTPQFDFTTAYFRVRLPGHPKYIVHSVRSRADNLCAKGNKADAVKLITAFLEKNPTMWSETLIVKLIELLGDDKNDPKYSQHHSFIEERKQRRIPLKEKLSKWCETEILDISAGVKLVKNLVEEGAGISDVSCVVSKASDLCKKKGDHRQNLEALQNAHKLYEALGEVVLTDASVSFQYADCTFNLYVLNTETDEGSRQGNGSQERRNLLPLLQKAEDYVKTAKQLTMKDNFKNMSLQYRLLGYIHSQRCSVQKSNEKQVTDCYDKARLYDPNIEINSVFIPADSRSRYRSPSSAQNTKPERQTAETSKRVIRSWPPTGKSGSVD